MLLKNLIKNCPLKLGNIKIKGICSDSRKIQKNDLFFALKGKKKDGNKFIKDVFKKGVKVVICRKNSNVWTRNNLIKVNNINKLLEKACIKFYNKKPRNIIAVTGTNGKSSVADFFFQILKQQRISVASIGTLGLNTSHSSKKVDLTTPDLATIHRELFNLKKKGIDNVIIEASSHGLDQGRLNGINFKAGIFTNLSQDHLDYHKSMQNYFKAKMILFSKILKKNAFVITDSKLKEFHKIKKIVKNKNTILDINQKKIRKLGFKDKFKLPGEFQFKFFDGSFSIKVMRWKNKLN